VVSDTWMHPTGHVDSMRDAVFMESPKMENLGRRLPIRPLVQGPVCTPMRMVVRWPLLGMVTRRAAASMSLANAMTRAADSAGSWLCSTSRKPSGPWATTPALTM